MERGFTAGEMTQKGGSDDEERCSSLAEIASLPKYFPGLLGCRSVDEYHCMNRIEEGSYGIVYKAKEKRTGVCFEFVLLVMNVVTLSQTRLSH